MQKKSARIIPWSTLLAAMVLTAAALPGQDAAPRQQAQASPTTREDRWRADLKFFTEQFPALQIDFSKLYPEKTFRREVSQLDQDVQRLSDSEIVLRLMRLVASAGVSHTTVYWPEGDLAFHSYPLQLAWYADGAAVIAAAEEYKAAVGARVVRIGTMTPEQLESAVAAYIPHENLPWLHQLSPSFMVKQEVAAHFGLAGPDGSIELTLAKPGAAPLRRRVAPLAPGTHPKVVSIFDELPVPAPLYRKQPSANYWYEYLPESHTLFIQYNRCAEDPKKPFKDFADELFRIVDDPGNAVQRVVVDLRFNQGGNSSVVKPLVAGLKARPQLNTKGRLYALIGRATFSSGMLAAFDFRDNLHGILVGEPIGGKPNEYGEVRKFALPHSRLEIQYTTKYFHLLKYSNPATLEPDIKAARSIDDLLTGRDAALEAALKHPLQ